MRADDLTRAQARALKNKLTPMVDYLNRLGKRMSNRGFPDDDLALALVTNALKAMYELQTEMQCRSIDGKGRDEKPPGDPLFARTSAPRKQRSIVLGERDGKRTNDEIQSRYATRLFFLSPDFYQPRSSKCLGADPKPVAISSAGSPPRAVILMING